MGIKLTKEQSAVVETRKCNLLVAAAAGSGKTAVLVERIIGLITDSDNPCDIDEFLIVTFTRAAASEMKDRLFKALEKKLDNNPCDSNLKRQIKLVNYANICTIDSFCQSVLREHFNEASISPKFYSASEDELKKINDEVLDDIFNEHLINNDELFIKLCDTYERNNKVKPVKDMVLSLYQTAQSYPWPIEWLEEQIIPYKIQTVEELTEAPWYKNQIEEIRVRLQEIIEGYRDLLDFIDINLNINRSEPVLHPYYQLIREELNALELVASLGDGFEVQLSDMQFGRLPTKKLKDEDTDARSYAKDTRNAYKDEIKEMALWLIPDKESYLAQIAFMSPVIEELIKVTKEFTNKVMDRKKSDGVFSFSDIEHMVLNILVDSTSKEIKEVAKEYKGKFRHVLCDEYQDSNLLQEEILRSVARDGDESNYFMVGDVKQSIYRFRKARPDLFVSKYNKYKENEEFSKVIDLSKNFRSRKNVTELVNSIFYHIMHKDIGGVEYDLNAALDFGADYYKGDSKDYKPELILVETDDEEFTEAHLSKDEIEAMVVATKINKIVGKLNVMDKEELRPARFSDIVILHRSANTISDLFIEVLKRYNIPAKSASMGGYFDSYEVESVLAMLSCINNPFDDIALTTVLKNIYGFTKDDLTRVRVENKDEFFSRAFFDYVKSEKSTPKAKEFYRDFTNLRESLRNKRVFEIVPEILKVNDFVDRIYAMPDGSLRVTNIDKIIDLSINFENTKSGGLYDFIKYIKELREYEIDVPISAENQENCVQIMTIHKSKGLEFPICILSGAAKEFRKNSSSNNMLVNDTYGVGFDYIDRKHHIKMSTVHKNILKRVDSIEETAEIQRVLYVALTRAKEKLILTGALKAQDIQDKLYASRSINIDKHYRLKAPDYLSLVLPSFIHEDSIIDVVGSEYIIEDKLDAFIDNDIRNKNLAMLEKIEDAKAKELLSTIEYTYPIKAGLNLKSKYSVSEVKSRFIDFEEDENLVEENGDYEKRIPVFIEDCNRKENIGAKRGTAFHRFMECVNFEAAFDFDKELDLMVKKGLLLEEEAKLINKNSIIAFFNTDLSRRMIKANKEGLLYKEDTFVCSVNTKELFPSIDFDELEENDTTLIQGIIDAYFIEEGKIVLLDYKTDKVNNEEELKIKYKTQFLMYKDALERAKKLSVKEMIIYSFALNKEIRF